MSAVARSVHVSSHNYVTQVQQWFGGAGKEVNKGTMQSGPCLTAYIITLLHVNVGPYLHARTSLLIKVRRYKYAVGHVHGEIEREEGG